MGRPRSRSDALGEKIINAFELEKDVQLLKPCFLLRVRIYSYVDINVRAQFIVLSLFIFANWNKKPSA